MLSLLGFVLSNAFHAESPFNYLSLIPGQNNVQSRFERFLDAVKGTGPDSIDSLAMSFYTAEFRLDSILHWALSNS